MCGSQGGQVEPVLEAKGKEPARSRACFSICKTKGWMDEMISNIPSGSKIFMRPDTQLNNSFWSTRVSLSGADTAPNIRSGASSRLQTSLGFFIGKFTNN